MFLLFFSPFFACSWVTDIAGMGEFLGYRCGVRFFMQRTKLQTSKLHTYVEPLALQSVLPSFLFHETEQLVQNAYVCVTDLSIK